MDDLEALDEIDKLMNTLTIDNSVNENCIKIQRFYKKWFNKRIKNNILQVLLKYIREQKEKIIEEKGSRNVSRAFLGIGDEGEYWATILFHDTWGCASKGGCAFDNIYFDQTEQRIISAKEIKTCCRIQPKDCTYCHRKVAYFKDKCPFCDNDSFKYNNDSRFSIDAKSHVDYKNKIRQYLVFVIDNILNEINIKCFVINSSNSWFDQYINNQLNGSAKSNTCNMLPYKFDFHCSGSIKIFDISFNLDQEDDYCIHFFDRFNNVYENIPVSIFTHKEKKNYNINPGLESISYLDIIDKIEHRKKAYNRKRGVISRT